jgi:hypothetical protein
MAFGRGAGMKSIMDFPRFLTVRRKGPGLTKRDLTRT